MKPWLRNRWWLFALRLALGGLFVYAGAAKISNPQQFADSIHTFLIFPPETVNLIAILLPPLEILLGALLVTGWNARAGIGGIFVLTIFFTVVLGQAAFRGIPVDCGCFGSGLPSIRGTYLSLARTIGILICSGFLWRMNDPMPRSEILQKS